MNPATSISDLLPEAARELLYSLAQCAHTRGQRAFLGGGFLRNVLLGLPAKDIDVFVDTKAHELAEAFTTALMASRGTLRPGRLWRYPELSAAKLYMLSEVACGTNQIDFSSLDTKPALSGESSLFTQKHASRDFTMNAISASLSPEDFLELSDPHGGRLDLQKRVIRTMSAEVFESNPAAIVRAIRFEQNLGLTFEDASFDQLRSAIAARLLASLGIEKLYRLATRTFSESTAVRIIARLDQLGCLDQVIPGLSGITGNAARAQSILDALSSRRLYALGEDGQGRAVVVGLFPRSASKEFSAYVNRFGPHSRLRADLTSARANVLTINPTQWS